MYTFYSEFATNKLFFLALEGKMYNLLEMATLDSCYQCSGEYNLFNAYGQCGEGHRVVKVLQIAILWRHLQKCWLSCFEKN